VGDEFNCRNELKDSVGAPEMLIWGNYSPAGSGTEIRPQGWSPDMGFGWRSPPEAETVSRRLQILTAETIKI